MSQFTYFHNPRCSKSRQGLALLEEKSVDFKVREYLKEPLSSNELKELFSKLEIEPLKALRNKESIFKELELGSKELQLSELCKIVAENPILLERPILASSSKAKIGRPPEDLLEII